MAFSPEMMSRLYRFSGRSAARLVALVRDTSTITVEPADARDLIASHHPFIFAMWHGQFMMLPALHTTGINVSAIVAKHSDAEVLGELLQRFDISIVRGAGAGDRAKDRGGSRALRMALKLLNSGSTFSMTADVPPGPARVAGMGIVTLARMSGRPIIPFAAATSRYIALNSWSRMTINLPYGKLSYVIGSPIHVPREADEAEMERCRLLVEHGLNAVTARAYELAGADARRATPPLRPARQDKPMAPGFKLKAYRAAGRLAGPLLPLFLAMRERRGKEDPARRPERFGIANVPRPEGPLAWIHAASVGETNAVLPLIPQLKSLCPGLNVVLTTGTLTSAGLASQRLPSGSLHQLVPLDTQEAAKRFLAHWQPDVAIFTESEIWPNLILETHARAIPLALVNARMSPRSHRRWARNPGAAAPLFGRFDIVLAQSPRFARWFKSLGARHVVVSGNLKIDAPPPPVDMRELDRLRTALAGRPVFVAASTHDGEDEIVAAAHTIMLRSLPGLVTIIAPRHPERGAAIQRMLAAKGIAAVQRSQGALPDKATEIYVADTIGELGTLYALAPVAFIGGSLVERGGQNPIEAIAHGSAVITGPHWTNFQDTYRTLFRHKGAIEAGSAEALAQAVQSLLSNESEQQRLIAGGKAAVTALGGALEATAKALAPFLPKPEGTKPEGMRRAS